MDVGTTPGAENGGVGGRGGERSMSLTGEDSDMEMFDQFKSESLIPLKEDLSEWITKTLGVTITAETFLSVMDSGVVICKLARVIEKKAVEQAGKAGQKGERVPSAKIKFKENAKSESWFARDNVANFLSWARGYGVKEECMFETEGLVLHREERSVVLCLLELARIAYGFGLDPPNLIKLEKEIEREEKTVLKPANTPVKKPPAGADGKGTPRKRLGSAKSVDELDTQVRKIVQVQSNKCRCPNCYQTTKISEGRYKIGDKNMFVRLLKGKHVMVRVGGGWDTLQHYIQTHDPCKILEFKRTPSAMDVSKDDAKFLYIHGKYKA